MDKIAFFKGIGFSEYESKALSSLIKLKLATPKQISEYSLVPQNKLYQIIKKFQNMGIISLEPAETKKYKLINIQTFIKNKLKEKQDEFKQLKQSSKILEKLKEKNENFSFQVIIGQKAIMDKLSENNQNCKKEIIGVQRNWKYWAEGIRSMQSTIKKGVKVKLIGEINEENKERVEEWRKTGCKIKAYNKKFGEFPLRFSIFDNKEARITIGKPEIQNPDDYITIWTTSKPIIALLRRQFLEMWNSTKKQK